MHRPAIIISFALTSAPRTLITGVKTIPVLAVTSIVNGIIERAKTISYFQDLHLFLCHLFLSLRLIIVEWFTKAALTRYIILSKRADNKQRISPRGALAWSPVVRLPSTIEADCGDGHASTLCILKTRNMIRLYT